MCECYQVGVPFVAEAPDCPAHGTAAQLERGRREREASLLEAEVQAWRQRFPQYVYRPQDDCVALR